MLDSNIIQSTFRDASIQFINDISLVGKIYEKLSKPVIRIHFINLMMKVTNL